MVQFGIQQHPSADFFVPGGQLPAIVFVSAVVPVLSLPVLPELPESVVVPVLPEFPESVEVELSAMQCPCSKI